MKSTNTAAQAITRPEYITRAIFAIIEKLDAQRDEITETGRPALNRQTLRKLDIITPIWDRITAGKRISTADQVRALQALHTSENMTAKLEDVNAMSTACSVNPICKARAADACSICAHCFAFTTLDRYNDLEQAAVINFVVLNMMIYSPAAWKAISIPASAAGQLFRVEAFGDTASAIQAANYTIMAATHRYLGKVGIWSKNLGYWATAFENLGKPANVVFNASSPVLNQPMEIPDRFKWFIDHVFTVYDAAHALAEEIDINCGMRNCKDCRHCYKRSNAPAVNEILKQEAKRYYKARGINYKGRGK
ncbi:MAG: hypothetical protein IJ943_09245 [Akkermansia sp.]|nr:hypothetical protein [Akkermansia sp.]